MRRFLRYLRIAFSATCAVACVLLIVLCVRSYWIRDGVSGNNGLRYLCIDTFCDELHCDRLLPVNAAMSQARPWTFFHIRSSEYEQQLQRGSELKIRRRWLGIGWLSYTNGWEVVVPLWPAPLVAGCL